MKNMKWSNDIRWDEIRSVHLVEAFVGLRTLIWRLLYHVS